MSGQNTVKSLSQAQLPGPKAPLTEVEIANFVVDSQNYEAMKTQLKQLEEDLKARETNMISRLEAGAPLRTKAFWASIGQDTRRTVAWKELAIGLWTKLGFDGKREAQLALDNAPVKVTKYLVIQPRPSK